MGVQIVKLLDPLNPTIITGGLVPRGAYSAATNYAVGDSVDYLGSSYVMFNDAAAGVAPTDTAYWQVVAAKGDTGATGATGATGVAGAAGAAGTNGGMSRVLSSVSTPTSAAAAASTDYVYFVSGTTTVTLPTAIGNTNRYTINNDGASTVTVATTASQTINGSATVTLSPNSTLEFLSNNTQWKVI